LKIVGFETFKVNLYQWVGYFDRALE